MMYSGSAGFPCGVQLVEAAKIWAKMYQYLLTLAINVPMVLFGGKQGIQWVGACCGMHLLVWLPRKVE
jgi:hypothetical protein